MAKIANKKSLGALTFVLLLTSILISLPFSINNWTVFQDFGSFLVSGDRANNGLNPYGDDPGAFHIVMKAVGIDLYALNMNPPLSIPVFALLAKFPPIIVLVVWKIILVLCYLAIIVILFKKISPQPHFLKLVWLLSLAGFWLSLDQGQIYFPLILLALAAQNLLDSEKDVIAGILFGILVAWKPNFILWPFFLAIGLKKWKLLLSSLTTTAILSILPVAIYGASIYRQWFNASQTFKGYTLPGASLTGLTAYFGNHQFGIILSIILISSVSVWIYFKKMSPVYIHTLAAITSTLASPIAWAGYTLFALPYFFYKQRWTVPQTISAILLAIPFPVIGFVFQVNFLLSVAAGWAYGWALIFLLYSIWLDTQAA